VGVPPPTKTNKFSKIKKMIEQFKQTIKDWLNEPVILISLLLIIIFNIII